MVSTSGAQLLPQDAISLLKEVLIPMTTVITPNIPEAKLLLGKQDEPNPQTRGQMLEMAKGLHRLGPKYVLVKGGHFRPAVPGKETESQRVVDVLYGEDCCMLIEKDFLKSRNTHGTGCSLACRCDHPFRNEPNLGSGHSQ